MLGRIITFDTTSGGKHKAGHSFPSGDGANEDLLATDGSGALSFLSPALKIVNSGSGTITIKAGYRWFNSKRVGFSGNSTSGSPTAFSNDTQLSISTGLYYKTGATFRNHLYFDSTNVLVYTIGNDLDSAKQAYDSATRTLLPVTRYLPLGYLDLSESAGVYTITNLTNYPYDSYNNDASASKFIARSSNYSASNGDRVLLDTSGGPLTVTLPSSPSVGNQVYVYDSTDSFETNNCTVDRNGQSIEGVASNYTINTSGSKSEFVFVGGSKGWKIF